MQKKRFCSFLTNPPRITLNHHIPRHTRLAGSTRLHELRPELITTPHVARGLFVGILVTAISLFFVPFQVHSWVFVALTLVLTAVLFSLAGLLNGVFAKTFDDISLVPTFVLTPLTYLGGVFYSLTLLPPFWQGLSHLNPIVYMISGFRYGFLGINDVPLVTTFGVLVVFIVAFYLICWSLIQRGRGLRS